MLVSALAVCVLGVAAVSCSWTVDADPPAPAVLRPGWPGCSAVGAFDDSSRSVGPPGSGSIPPDFQPRVAVLCAFADRTSSAGDPISVRLERRATAIEPLLGYLAQPSRRSTWPDRLACPAMGWAPPWLFLLDDSGTWMSPQVPTDPCGFALGLFSDEGPPFEGLDYSDHVVRE